MEITYKSAGGSFMADGGGGKSPLKIRSFEGLGLPPRSRKTVTYTGRAGQSLISSSFDARTVTLGLDLLLTGSEAQKYENEMLAAAAEDGVLQIGGREIGCSVVSLTPAQICKGNYPRYAIQFICDYPYFRDITPVTADLFKRVSNIKSTFSFPLVVSTLENSSVIVNDGVTAAEPIISIRLGESAVAFPLDAGSTQEMFKLTNQTTGAVIELDLSGFSSGSFTVDIPNRRIYSPDAELTDLLADNIFMCDFTLSPGENRITAVWGDGTTPVYASVSFRREYLGVEL